MTSRDFCYWLQGFFELNNHIDHRDGMTPEGMECIKNHLAMVFRHEIDPSFKDDLDDLRDIHDSKTIVEKLKGIMKQPDFSFDPGQSLLNCQEKYD